MTPAPTEALDFYFDFSSPYGYFMAERIDALAGRFGRDVRWRPFLLGAVYQRTGGTPLPSQPLKGDYALRDILRSARFLGLPCTLPDPFPIGTQVAARAFYWLDERDPALARRFALNAFRAYFVRGENLAEPAVVCRLAGELGADAPALSQALGDPALKTRLKEVCTAALERGVFGSPFVVVDNEPFWGIDRLPQLEAWLARGGF